MSALPRIEGGAIAVPFARGADADELAQLRSRGADLFELRLDLAGCTDPKEAAELAASFAGHPLIVTCRSAKDGGEGGDDVERLLLIAAAIEHATAIDVELSAAPILPQAAELAKANACELIVSYHDFKQLPTSDFLAEITQQALVANADIVKIAVTVASQNEIDALVAFTEQNVAAGHVMAVMGMGDEIYAANSRVQLANSGSLFVFGAGDTNTAPGMPQLDWLVQNMR